MKRGSGILLHISSLPSNYGIGALGKEAYDFVDFLKASGQTYWQILPLGPTGFGDSPYQSFSAYAGNPYFIDLDILVEENLIKRPSLDLPISDNSVDYGKLFENRSFYLKEAYTNKDIFKDEFEDFKSENSYWLLNYALFMAIKEHHNMISWLDWEDDIRLHKKTAVTKYMLMLKDEINYQSFVQFLFFRQFNKLKEHINESGIKLIGDLPLYVSLDSSDVWSNSDLFQLDSNNIPKKVAGVPPDYFSKTGQLWGNPLYDWKIMKKDNYTWWMNRLSHSFKLYDIIRFDHFRGLDRYWNVPYGSKTAVNGRWAKGPGKDFIKAVNKTLPDSSFIAEDLGLYKKSTERLLRFSGYPGMRVLQFGFDGKAKNPHLPHNYIKNSVCYTGTHDNATIAQWTNEADSENLSRAKEYLGIDVCKGFIESCMESVSDVFIAQMQDYLRLGKESRMNLPGTTSGNWRWRMEKDSLTEELSEEIFKTTKLSKRIN